MENLPVYEFPLTGLIDGCHTACIGTREILIIESDGGLRVYDGVCPHLGGPLTQGRISRTAIVCPWHEYEFDAANGRCRTIPGRIWHEAGRQADATEPMRVRLKALPFDVEDGIIKVYG